ncbi:MAG: MerR family transcriptional regulator [Chloroflexota bacterium]
MIRIGLFSRFSQVSIKTLRYYDEQGLFHPAKVDEWTGYRYYTFDQLPRLYRILALKEMGFPLEQIGHLLKEELSPDQMRGMLRTRQLEIQTRLEEEKERLERVKSWLELMDKEHKMSQLEVVIKQIKPLKVAGLRGIIPAYSQQLALWGELEGYLAMHRIRPTGPCFTQFFDDEYKESDVDAEVCEPIDADPPEHKRIRVYTLPEVMVASAIHNGPYKTLNSAIQDMLRWIEMNGYHICGPEREIYLRAGRNGSQTDPKTVTEVQFPVSKN